MNTAKKNITINQENIETKQENKNYNLPVIYLGIIGMMSSIVGIFMPADIQKWFYVSGSVFLLIASIVDKNMFFTGLQIIVLSGTTIAMTHLPNEIKILSPILMTFVIFGFFIKSKLFKDYLIWLGSAGIFALSMGYALLNSVLFFVGSFFLACYSYYSFRKGVTTALMFAILNAIFCLAVLFKAFI